jgi:hypothetical protein
MIRKRMNEKLKKVGCDELHYLCGLEKDPQNPLNIWIG